MCNRCWSRHPSRPLTQAANLAAGLAEPPEWLEDFAEFAAARHCVGRACVMISAVGRLLREEPSHPQLLLERARCSGRSAGSLARTLEDYFLEHHLAFGLDQEARLAADRRRRRVEAVPSALRPAVAAFADHLVRSRERARRASTLERADSTIEGAIAIVRDLARFLVTEATKTDWATVDVGDIETFLRQQPANRRRRLSASRQFFRWARANKLVLVDPTAKLPPSRQRGFAGPTLTVGEQRQLFRRWTSGERVHVHEALVGILALLHAASSGELRHLRLEDIDERRNTIRLGQRRHRVPLDPVTSTVLRRCLDHRDALTTLNPHVIVTKATKTRSTPASQAYMAHVLDGAGVPPKRLRSTRLLDLIISLDPKVVAEALGMNAGGLVTYLADSVDAGRLGDRG